MGTNRGESADERPLHRVTIGRPFLLQRTEVTQQQWRAVMDTNPSHFKNCGESCPVERVSWDDVQIFLQRLNKQDPGKGYRLPTEAEWEYAARAGSTGDYGVSGGLCSFAWVEGCGGGAADGTRRVAMGGASEWGLYDMHGNVSEWVSDWWADYAVNDRLKFPTSDRLKLPTR
jgi:formylglycine-generating enzyme required for sulfatase activity